MALTIDPDTVCFLIIKARAFAAMIPPEGVHAGDNPADDDERTALVDVADNTAGEELRGALESLSEEHRAEVLALVWIGREDFAAEQWAEAMTTARTSPERRRPDALLGLPLFADYLEEGFTRLGYDCRDMERDHL